MCPSRFKRGSLLSRTIFAQTDQTTAWTELKRVAEHLEERFPRQAALLAEAHDNLVDTGFPHEHGKQIASTNPLERVNREIGRRADVVGIPNQEQPCDS